MTDEKTINIGASARLTINIGAGAELNISTGAGSTITASPRRVRVDTREQIDLREKDPHRLALPITELPKIPTTADDVRLAEAERHIDAAREAAASITGKLPTLAELPAAIEACRAALLDAKRRYEADIALAVRQGDAWRNEHDKMVGERNQARTEHDRMKVERDGALAAVSAARGERDEAVADRDRLTTENARLRSDLELARRDPCGTCRADRAAAIKERDEARHELATRSYVLTSERDEARREVAHLRTSEDTALAAAKLERQLLCEAVGLDPAVPFELLFGRITAWSRATAPANIEIPVGYQRCTPSRSGRFAIGNDSEVFESTRSLADAVQMCRDTLAARRARATTTTQGRVTVDLQEKDPSGLVKSLSEPLAPAPTSGKTAP